MEEVIKSVYRYFLNSYKKPLWRFRYGYTHNHYKWALRFIKNYYNNKGKSFCWHDWEQFEVVHAEYHNNGFAPITARCSKCGKIDRVRVHRARVNTDMIDPSMRVSWF